MNRTPSRRVPDRLSLASVAGRYRQLFVAGRTWILVVAGMLVAAIVAGVLGATLQPESHLTLVRETTQRMRPALEALLSGDNGRAIAMIFRNNVGVSLFVMGCGALIFPAFMAVAMIGVTGYLIGTLAVLSNQGIGPLLLSLAPHGVFEIPALVLAGAWSLRMAFSWLLPPARGQRGDVWRATIVEGLWLIPVIIALLAVAAVVEVMVTAPLVRGLMGA